MWAYRLEGPLHFVRHEIDRPAPDDLARGDVLLRFLAGGVCGSDIVRCREGAGSDRPAPFGLSLHEIVGEVVASRSDLAVGERVVGWVSDSHGLCEYVATPAQQLTTVESTMDDVHAVALQPLACVLFALSRLPGIEGARVAVIGLGPIGLLFCHVLKTWGADSVLGVDTVARTNPATRFGLDRVEWRASRPWSRTREASDAFDLVVEAVGHQVGTLDDAIEVAAPGGTVLYFGNPDELYYPVRFGTLMDKNLTLHAGRTPVDSRRDALRHAQEYVAKHPELPEMYVSHVVPVSDTQEAYSWASQPRSGQLKVVLDGRT